MRRQDFDSNAAIQTGVAGAVNLPHTTGTQRRLNFVRTEFSACGERHSRRELYRESWRFSGETGLTGYNATIMDGKNPVRWLFDSQHGAVNRLIPRWLFLRALGLIYFSAFYSLVFQIRGLIGPNGILPANGYLKAVSDSVGHLSRYWYAPSLLWISSGSTMLVAICWAGMIASLLLVLNLWPRGMLVICFVCFLSFVSAAQDFSGYQSDGMLLEAGFISLF